MTRDGKDTMQAEVAARQKDRNDRAKKINWQFTTSDARIKLKCLLPLLLCLCCVIPLFLIYPVTIFSIETDKHDRPTQFHGLDQKSLANNKALLLASTTYDTKVYPPVDRDKAAAYFKEGDTYLARRYPVGGRNAYYKALESLNIKVRCSQMGLTYYDTDIDPLATDQEIAGIILGRIELLERVVAFGRLPASYTRPIHGLNGWIASLASIALLEAARSRIDFLELGKRLEIGSTLRESYDGAVFWAHELSLVMEEFSKNGKPKDSLVSLLPELSYANAAFLYADRSRSRAMMDFLAALDQIGDWSLLREWYVRQMVTRFLGWSRFTAIIDRSTAERKQKIDEKLFNERNAISESEGKRLQEVQHWLNSSNPGMLDQLQIREAVCPSFSDIQRTLRPREALLEYHITESGVYVFVVKQYGDVELELAARSSQEIINSAMAYSSILSSEKERPWKNESKQLYEDLIEPVATAIRDCNRLVIVPDGILNAIPFQSLINKKTKRLLLDDYTVRYIPAASLLVRQNKWKPSNGRSMILAISQFTNHKTLKESEQEATDIAEYLKDSADLFLDSKYLATKELFFKNAPTYELVHVSSHGRYDIFDPIMSYVILKGQNRLDERVSAFEILTRLFSARLVVLSACETYLSRSTNVSTGGDMFGLTQTFIISGVQSIMASAWQVKEGPTRELMKEFYSRIARCKSKAIDVALKEGQIEIRKKHPHPYYWASFVVYGRGD